MFSVILRSIFWYSSSCASLILKTPVLFIAKGLIRTGRQNEYDNLIYAISADWAAERIKQSGADITVHNLERIPSGQNVLFVSNHQSNFDIPVFLSCIDKQAAFVAKAELEKVPFLNSWMKGIHCLFIDRRNIRQSSSVILEGINMLKNGYSIVIFPEGTRSRSNKIGKFKPGSFKLATKSGVPIVPVTIDGTYKIMEENNYLVKPAVVNVYIHKPIYPDKLSAEEKANIHNRVRTIISSKLPKQ